MFRSLVFVLVFIAGYSVMSIELLGGRILAPYFGNSIYVWGSIISVFMLALAIGYLIGGQLSLHQPTLRKFGLLFLLAATAIVPLVLFADPVMKWIFSSIYDPRYGSLCAALLLFLLPTLILGIVSPYAIRLLVLNAASSGHMAGKLYFVSTLGSALGTLATSFYLVLYFQVNHILLALAGILLVSGAATLLQRMPAPTVEVTS
ncbi:MAG TPA: fused MFS/spermidine synthase [Gammaproteobacteria bacterium]|nr:fused MFS/spermidine synthase [Gammaproteobacteria bacterium]